MLRQETLGRQLQGSGMSALGSEAERQLIVEFARKQTDS